jgi:thymidylate synthase
MKVFNVRNVHEALPIVVQDLLTHGVEKSSRNGPVLVFSEPVTTVYEKPLERVLFYPERDANPFFHLMESLWMLAGRNDIAFPCRFVKTMVNFSDDGKTFHAAYGHRWRKHFKIDQLEKVSEMLKENPEDRRAVVSMWDSHADGLGREGKDFACNLQALFSIRDEKLDMMVTNRSNDIIWGAYGANAVHFSYLQEFMAAAIGVPVGKYYQVSNNFHAYKNTLEKVKDLKPCSNPYDLTELQQTIPLINTDMKTWHQDLLMFMEEGPIVGFRDRFFRRVVTPVWQAHEAFKNREDEHRFEKAKEIIQQCADIPWMLACWEWLDRREKSFSRAKDDGVNYETTA